MEPTFTCAIVGGGAAGLTAALVLGRARVPTLLVDAGGQSNRPAHAVGGLLGHDGSPAELYDAARAQLAAHPAVEVVDGTVTGVLPVGTGRFQVRLADGSTVEARRILLAAGMAYGVPDLPGVAELWGDTVFHCPYCHGWEVADRPLAVLGTSVHQALMLTAWSGDVVLLTSGGTVGPEDADLLHRAGVPIDPRPVVGLRAEAGRLASVCFEDGSELRRDALLVATPLEQRGPLVADLGVALTDHGAVQVDAAGRTSVPGVFAAGDLVGSRPSITAAMASGTMAAVALHHSVLGEDIGLAQLL